MPSRLIRFSLSLPACALAGSLLVAAQTPPPAGSTQSTASRTAKDGVYSDAQALRGQTVYKDKCASCHGATLGGANAPPLAGDAFIAVWGGPLSDLVDKIQNTMPLDDPGKLTRQQSAELVAYMLQASKFPAGRADLGADAAVLKQIAVAPGQTAPAVAAAGSQTPSFPAAGNLNQVMRGILFPSSNIIFNVQTNDPGAPAPKPAGNQAKDASFSMTAWGAGIYRGGDYRLRCHCDRRVSAIDAYSRKAMRKRPARPGPGSRVDQVHPRARGNGTGGVQSVADEEPGSRQRDHRADCQLVPELPPRLSRQPPRPRRGKSARADQSIRALQ